MRFFPPQTSNNLKGSGMLFYCKDCEKVVDVFPVGRKFVYKCAICKTKNVAFGTEKSIRNFFHVAEEEKPAIPAGSTGDAFVAAATKGDSAMAATGGAPAVVTAQVVPATTKVATQPTSKVD